MTHIYIYLLLIFLQNGLFSIQEKERKKERKREKNE